MIQRERNLGKQFIDKGEYAEHEKKRAKERRPLQRSPDQQSVSDA